jgi:hypothetical protein
MAFHGCRHARAAQLEADPGTRWSYANRDTLLLVRAMRDVLGGHAYWRFPIREPLDPIGMRRKVPETDAHGNYILSSQAFSTPLGSLSPC